MLPLDPSFIRKKNSSHIIPCKWGENSRITYKCTLHIGAFMTKVKFQENINTHSAMNGLRMHHLHPFFTKKKCGRTPPPPPCERKNSPHQAYRRVQLWRQKLHTILGEKIKNQEAICKNGLRIHHLHLFFKNFLKETPTPLPLLREDKLPSLALNDPLLASDQISPRTNSRLRIFFYKTNRLKFKILTAKI